MSRARLALVEPPKRDLPDHVSGEIPFSKDEAVEVTQGASKGIRGRVIGPARSMYLGVADVAIRTETGREAWIRPDFLRRLA